MHTRRNIAYFRAFFLGAARWPQYAHITRDPFGEGYTLCCEGNRVYSSIILHFFL